MKLFAALYNMFKQSPVLLAITLWAVLIICGSTWGVITLASQRTSDVETAPITETSTTETAAPITEKKTSKQNAKKTAKKPAPKPTTSTTTTMSTSGGGSSGSSSGGGSSGGSSGGGSSTTCKNPVFTTSDTNGGWSTAGYYVHNNMWNVSGYSVSETLKACSYHNWYVTATADNSANDGAVKTYPNVHKDYSGRTIASFSSLTSSFAATSPHVGIYNVAYDIWINGVPNEEVMIWTENYKQYPAGSKFASNVSLSGYSWDVYATGDNGYIAFVPSGGARITSGTLNLKAMLNYLVSKGKKSSSDTIDQICYGVEIVSTGGNPATFNFTNFSIND